MVYQGPKIGQMDSQLIIIMQWLTEKIPKKTLLCYLTKVAPICPCVCVYVCLPMCVCACACMHAGIHVCGCGALGM